MKRPYRKSGSSSFDISSLTGQRVPTLPHAHFDVMDSEAVKKDSVFRDQHLSVSCECLPDHVSIPKSIQCGNIRELEKIMFPDVARRAFARRLVVRLRSPHFATAEPEP